MLDLKECLDSGDDSDNHDDEKKIKRTKYSISVTFCRARSCNQLMLNEHCAVTTQRDRVSVDEKMRHQKKGIRKQIFHQKEFKVKCPKLKLFENS